jgi:hypothetical protein
MRMALLILTLVGGAIASIWQPTFDFTSFAVGIASIRFADLLREKVL